MIGDVCWSIAVATVIGGLAADRTQARSSQNREQPSELFELRSDPGPGLFHLLIDWALADAEEWPPYAPELVEREGWRSQLSASEAELWSAAVEAFSTSRSRSLLFDEGFLAVRDWAAGAADRSAIPDGDRHLADALDAARPVYERHWWSAHDDRNRAWIASVEGTLAQVEEAMVTRFERAYGGHWPDSPIPVDVVVYANPVSAYSSGGRITIASGARGNRMPQGLELIFHEASHVDPLEAPLRTALEDAYRAAGAEPPARLWHDLIFYTSGEITRITFEERGEPGYLHYGELGVYTRGERWTTELPAFERHWRPFLRSDSANEETRAAALEAFARELLDGS